MSNTPDNENLPALGRMMTWVDKPGSANKIFWALAALCAVLFLLDFTYDKHGHFSWEDIPGFYGLYGFVAFTCVIFGAKALRVIIKRPESYYGDHAIDTEDYPAEQTEQLKHGDDQ